MKRYANIDIFNDVTRPSNILSSKDLVPTKTHEDRFQTDIIINGKTNFEKDNTIISSLNDEIVSLKEKMRFVTEKDEKIHKLQLEITSLKKDNIDNNRIKEENSKYLIDNKKLSDESENIRIQLTRLHSLESENSNLKSKLVEYHKQLEEQKIKEAKKDKIHENIHKKNPDKIEEFSIEEILEGDEETIEVIQEPLIPIDVNQLKDVLFNRLQTYHEKHIDELITTYDLHSKSEISKKTLEELLKQAIHM